MQRTSNLTAFGLTAGRSASLWRRGRHVVISATVFTAISLSGLRAEAADADASAAPEANQTELKHGGSVFVDPLGFVVFGPTLGLEYGFDQFSLIAYGRWLNVGLVAKALFLNDNERFAFSYGAGLKGRYYLRPGLVGPHFGVAVELLRTRVEDDLNRIATNNTVVVPEAEAGYRFGFGRLFLNPSAGVGYAFQAAQSVENIDGGTQASSFAVADVSTIYASASLDVGLFF